MEKLNLPLVLFALGIVTLLTTPAFAHKRHRHPLHHQRRSHLRRQSGFYSYATIPLPETPKSDLPYYGNPPYDQRDDW
jgi:hypothetical protein